MIIKIKVIHLKKKVRNMLAEVPVSWTCIQLKFFYSKIHEDRGLPDFPKTPKFFIAGKIMQDTDSIEDFLSNVALALKKDLLALDSQLKIFVSEDTSRKEEDTPENKMLRVSQK